MDPSDVGLAAERNFVASDNERESPPSSYEVSGHTLMYRVLCHPALEMYSLHVVMRFMQALYVSLFDREW